ncbi:Carboxylic ester hydrolase [Temnothorax longispinosus]|uniref:Carboxylic ester hydrolase n=1 Tax=Temnothorax longispinosus TaxID=300112 RepID=A0A4S2KG32_9HYME|nr:Carboxylic ester hydrolase [Temnothorax longispinosus]
MVELYHLKKNPVTMVAMTCPAISGDEKEVFRRYYVNSASYTLNVTHIMRRSFARYDVSLFHKAILQSGIITSDWAMIRNQPEANSFKLASVLGNDSKDPEKVIEFLRTIPTVKIIKAQHKVLTPEEARTLNVPFGPTIDDRAKKPFLPYPISQLLDDDNNIPIMIGYTSHEYISLLQDTSEKTLKTMYADLPRYVGNFINSQDPEKIMQMTEKIKQKYFCNKLPFTEESIPSIIRWLSDLHFNIPIEDFVDKRRKKKHVPTYFYRFSYVGNEKIETNLINNNKLTAIGAAHTDDMSYLFYIPKYKINNPQPPAIDTKDRKMLEILTRMWTNFAKTGNPTPVLDQYVTTNWLPATADIFNYLDIGDTLQLLTITDYNSILQDVLVIMDRPIVTVNQGKLQGILEENLLGSHHYFSFKGIPFAAPPVGELRFKDPEPPTPWEGIRDASKNSDICAQLEHSKTQVVVGSEDCLYLNICVPYNVYRTTGNPVMVWIHGGGYVFGSGNDTHKRFDYLVKKDVILVSVNYRLGALGFLNLDHEVASGNQGLKDQVAALKWIKENIKAFGGDPNNITVFGVSAGSTCINLLMLSPLSKGI